MYAVTLKNTMPTVIIMPKLKLVYRLNQNVIAVKL